MYTSLISFLFELGCSSEDEEPENFISCIIWCKNGYMREKTST